MLTEFDAELHDKFTFEAGETKGEAIGLAKGEVKSLAKLAADGLIPLNVVVSQLKLFEEEFIQQALMLNISIKP